MRALAIRNTGLKDVARTIFIGLSTSYDKVVDYATLFQDRRWKAWLVERLAAQSCWTILDLGCGTGMLEEFLGGKRCTVVGLDLTEGMIRVAQQKGMARLHSLIVGDGEALPFREQSFDAVASCYVAKYCEPLRLASEIKRVLSPGGKVVLYDFSRPTGAFAPFHAFYVYGVLKIIGFFMSCLSREGAYTFTNLPGIIRSSTWDVAFPAALLNQGFSEVGRTALSGGVVTALCASRAA